MKRALIFLVFASGGMFRICSAETGNGLVKTNPLANPMKAPLVECGVMAGRDGAAFGPGITCQANFNRFGFYGFAGQSSVNGYQTSDGITANFSDRTLGFGLDARILHLNRFVFGLFGQSAYYGSHVRATYFDSDYQMSVTYLASDRDPLITVGPEIRFLITKGISGIVRPGKDFGSNFAATTAGGFSINGGILFSARSIGISLIQVKNLFHSTAPTKSSGGEEASTNP